MQTSLSGTLNPGSRPFTGFVVINAAGTKLDYYLDRHAIYARSSCSATRAAATFVLHNAAPSSGLPVYVTTRSDGAAKSSKPGDNRLLVSYFASPGATIETITLDGIPVVYAAGQERGLPTAEIDVELPVTSTRTLVVTVQEPAAAGAVQVLNQPLVRPMTVSVSAPAC